MELPHQTPQDTYHAEQFEREFHLDLHRTSPDRKRDSHHRHQSASPDRSLPLHIKDNCLQDDGLNPAGSTAAAHARQRSDGSI